MAKCSMGLFKQGTEIRALCPNKARFPSGAINISSLNSHFLFSTHLVTVKLISL